MSTKRRWLVITKETNLVCSMEELIEAQAKGDAPTFEIDMAAFEIEFDAKNYARIQTRRYGKWADVEIREMKNGN